MRSHADTHEYLCTRAAAVTAARDLDPSGDVHVVRLVRAGARLGARATARCANTGVQRVRVEDGWVSAYYYATS